jgi:cytochrome b subunit of formate dehydrogenase
MKVIILALVIIIPAMFVTGIAIGYRSGLRRNQALSLRALGLSTTTINRYRDAMRLLHGMVEATTLDGPYAGNILTNNTESEARRIIDGYRQEMGIANR